VSRACFQSRAHSDHFEVSIELSKRIGVNEGMDESKDAERARGARAELAEILERRPDLQGKSLEAVKRILRREARLSLRPRKTSNTRR
jgi:hypothetical protein